MAIASVIEWKDAMVQNNAVTPVPRGKLRQQNVEFTESTQTTNAVGPDCGLVQIVVDAACYWEMGTNPTATTSSAMQGAGTFWVAIPNRGIIKFAFLAK